MSLGKGIGSILQLAVIAGLIYAYFNWQSNDSPEGAFHDFAKNACIDAVTSRFDVRSVNVYKITESAQGYVVRASARLSRGDVAKVYCLTNEHGGVEDIGIEDR